MTNDHEVAWAAGVFDGDGTACGYVAKGRRSRTVQITVYQATTPILERFQRAMDGNGGIYGPYRGRLFHWTTKRSDAVSLVCARLWPNLGAEKRAQLRTAVAGHPVLEHALGGERPSTPPNEVAWAAGFFDAEGSVTLPKAGPPVLEIPQAEVYGGPSKSLFRFLAAVGVGRISGPRIVPSPWSRVPQYRWVAGSIADVTAVMDLLSPMLGFEKRDAIRRALNAYDERKSRDA